MPKAWRAVFRLRDKSRAGAGWKVQILEESQATCARMEAGAMNESPLQVRGASVGQRGQRRDGQLVGCVVKDEFEAADVTAIHSSRFG